MVIKRLLKFGQTDALKPWFKEQSIEVYHVNNSYSGPNTHSVAIVERFNRTFRDAVNHIRSLKSMNNTTAISYALKLFIPKYNDSVHSTLKQKPSVIYNGSNEILETTFNNQQERADTPKDTPQQDLKVGQKVYLQKPKQVIVNKHDEKYFEEAYTITGIHQTNPITYTLEDFESTKFYRQQLITIVDDSVKKKKGKYDIML